jgi:hypothetical protein
MTKVTLFGEEVILNKTIFVILDSDYGVFDLFPESTRSIEVACYSDLCRAIDDREKMIITPITHCISSFIMGLGYEIIVVSNGRSIKFSELLNGNPEKSFGKEIRAAQNWEKMLYAGCFDLDVPEIRRR